MIFITFKPFNNHITKVQKIDNCHNFETLVFNFDLRVHYRRPGKVLPPNARRSGHKKSAASPYYVPVEMRVSAELCEVKYFLMGISVIVVLWAGTFFLMVE
ncbi:membrane protein YpdK [Cedecea davisae]|uniref:Membrane protein YpdK n=2 Tax=Cedecea davisae TaxID=158484 RepID=A0ABS6DDP5_9ENTR|nr:membrane protein YpdK [Cedecea davisae]MBU4681258.1 membrane protein YpdK [Cedecea davisae]MBU4686336.1 membrane protein YpdK [Cedecea davisae]